MQSLRKENHRLMLFINNGYILMCNYFTSPENNFLKGKVLLSQLRVILLVTLCFMTQVASAESTLELEETEITGARELPKVLYIVPWKSPRPDSSPLPMRSLVNEALSPIDVDVFKRQVRYYEMYESSTGTTTK